MSIKIIICAFCLLGGGGAFAAGRHLHGSGATPPATCSGASNDLVYSNNCSGVYYPTIQTL